MAVLSRTTPPVVAPVLSVITHRRNADLIAEIQPLWIKPEDAVLDVTYGKGQWWKKYRPANLTTNDLDTSLNTDFHYAFNHLPTAWTESYDVVAFDPPYVCKGGRKTSTIPAMDAAYGLAEAPKNPRALFGWIDGGMKGCARVLRPKGRLLVKCSDFISSGKYQDGYTNILYAGAVCSLEHVDTFIHASGTGPQPKKNRDGSHCRQIHGRRAHSYLVVFKKP